MPVLQQSNTMLVTSVAVPLSWEGVKDSYLRFLMNDPTATVCIVAYIIITLLLIVFLLQPKAARTWVRPRRTEKGVVGTPLNCQSQIADICGTPVKPGSRPTNTDAANASETMTTGPKEIPPVGRRNKVTVEQVPTERQAGALLYITDNEASERLQELLGAAGLAVISSAPGKDAVRNLTVMKFDIIIIDTLVAEAARLCATRVLEALPPKPRMPVLIVLNHPGQTLNLAATNARIDYIFRPFDDALLVAMVGQMLTHKDREPAAAASEPARRTLPYDKEMERLVESLPQVADGIQQKSEQKSLSNMELQSGVLAALGEEAAVSLADKLKGEEPAHIAEEIKKTAEQVDELLRLCATVKPPKQQK